MVALRARHSFSASSGALFSALADPGYHATLELPDVGPPHIVACESDGDHTTIDVRYEFTGRLDPIARRIVGRDRVAWIQSLALDPGNGRAVLRIVPEARGVKMTCSAVLHFRDDARGGCTRVLDGELRVHVPVVGGRAETSIAPGILRRLDVEAAALERWVTVGGGSGSL
jgi:hypothetical protein